MLEPTTGYYSRLSDLTQIFNPFQNARKIALWIKSEISECGKTGIYILFQIQRCGYSNFAELNRELENVIIFLIRKLSRKIVPY